RIASYWKEPKSFPDVPETFMSPAAVKLRHVGGSEHPDRYDPSVWNDEIKFLAQPGQREIQEALLYDYRNNVATYPAWQEWLRVHQPKMLVVWGRNDSSFIVPGAMAFQRDVPAADIHILDAGHFALDEKVDEIAGLITAFMQKIAH
ncbi:alpha/beta hydrolase, partial [Hyphomicrobium sp.]|uniref:alpha/beta fold hydrolase n=1 Tax=Hyphomicrobium sp. TaxID=82 RepID=UPI0025C14A37